MITFEQYLNENRAPLTLDTVTKNESMNLIDCVFCDTNKIQATDIEEHQYSGENFLSFTPLEPITNGHLLVIPKKHLIDASDDPYLTGLCFGLACHIAEKRNYKNYNLIVNKGKHADQTVFHLHVHIVPRYENDKTVTIWNKDNRQT